MPSVIALTADFPAAGFNKKSKPWPIDRVAPSRAGALVKLGGSDALYVVAVREKPEALWLVAVIEAPRKSGKAWTGKKNTTPPIDITQALGSLRFASGTGVQVRKTVDGYDHAPK